MKKAFRNFAVLVAPILLFVSGCATTHPMNNSVTNATNAVVTTQNSAPNNTTKAIANVVVDNSISDTWNSPEMTAKVTVSKKKTTAQSKKKPVVVKKSVPKIVSKPTTASTSSESKPVAKSQSSVSDTSTSQPKSNPVPAPKPTPAPAPAPQPPANPAVVSAHTDGYGSLPTNLSSSGATWSAQDQEAYIQANYLSKWSQPVAATKIYITPNGNVYYVSYAADNASGSVVFLVNHTSFSTRAELQSYLGSDWNEVDNTLFGGM